MSFIPSVKCRLKQMRPLKWDRRRIQGAHTARICTTKSHTRDKQWRLCTKSSSSSSISANTHTHTQIKIGTIQQPHLVAATGYARVSLPIYIYTINVMCLSIILMFGQTKQFYCMNLYLFTILIHNPKKTHYDLWQTQWSHKVNRRKNPNWTELSRQPSENRALHKINIVPLCTACPAQLSNTKMMMFYAMI